MPPKKRKSVTGSPAPFKGSYSFVNKDASNIDSKDHNATVSWHVLHRYEKWKKQEQAKQPKNSTSAAPPDAISGAGATSSSFQLNPQVSFAESFTSEHQLPQKKEFRQEKPQYPPDPWQIEIIEQSVQNSNGESYNILNQYGLSAQPHMTTDFIHMNGFDLTTVDEPSGSGPQFPSLIDRIISFVHETVIPNTWPEEREKAKWTYEISRASNEIANIYSDFLFASASLCFYATLLASLTHNTSLASEACFWQTQTMGELRRRILDQSGPNRYLTLRAVLKLFLAETTLDNTTTARVHLKMLRTSIQSSGGVLLLDSWFRENLLAADCYFALKCETRPLFPASEWTPGPLNQPWRTSLTTQMANDHASTIGAAVEHAQLRVLITDLRELFQVEEYVNLHELQSDEQLLRWRQVRKFDCVNRLADHQLNVKLYPHLYREPKFHMAICTTIALMIFMVLTNPEPIRFGAKLIGDLEERLEAVKSDMSERVLFTNDRGPPINTQDVKSAILWMLHVDWLAKSIFPKKIKPERKEGTFEDIRVVLGPSTEQDQEDAKTQFLFSGSVEMEILAGRPHLLQDTIRGVYEACGTSWRRPNSALQGS